jgi:hypothetical protein
VTAKIICRVPYNTIPARAWWYRYRNEGFYVRVGTKVAFSGGGGTGAAGYAVVTGDAVTSVVVTNGGSGYTSAPTVTITGSGTGATATASIGMLGDSVLSVSVTAGGTGYKSGLKRATDANKEPTSKPVLLKANGEFEPNSALATFIERPRKQYALPYSVLGLF